MKLTDDTVKTLDERYESIVDDGLWETRAFLYEVTDPETSEIAYAVLIMRTFNDGVELYDKGHKVEMFETLDAALEYFNDRTAGMYKNPWEELLARFGTLLPKQKSEEN